MASGGLQCGSKVWGVLYFGENRGTVDQGRRKISFEGAAVDAIPVGLISATENWNEYLAADGAEIRLKSLATELFRLDLHDIDGNPRYVLRTHQVIVISAPEGLKKK